MLEESWLTSSVEARVSALMSRRYRVHRVFLRLLLRNWCSSRLETGVSGNCWSCLKEVKPVVLYDIELVMALRTMQGNRVSYQVDLGYTEEFRIPAETSMSF